MGFGNVWEPCYYETDHAGSLWLVWGTCKACFWKIGFAQLRE